MFVVGDEIKDIIGEKLFKEHEEIYKLTKNNREQQTKIAEKFKEFNRNVKISDERLNALLNASDGHITISKEEAEYLNRHYAIPLNENTENTPK